MKVAIALEGLSVWLRREIETFESNIRHFFLRRQSRPSIHHFITWMRGEEVSLVISDLDTSNIPDQSYDTFCILL